MKLQLEFPRKGYGPGDEVTANLDVNRAEGGVPEGATGTLFPTLPNPPFQLPLQPV